MKKTFILLLILSFYEINLAQDTLSAELYKKDQTWGPQTKNIQKAKKGVFKIKNEDGSLTTTYYSFVKNKIETSTTFKGEEPFGVWISTFQNDGKEIQEEIDYNFELVYCENTNLAKDVYDVNKVGNIEDVFSFAMPDSNFESPQKILSKVDYPQLAIDSDIEGQVYIRFVVNVDSSLSNFCIKRGTHVLLDKAAMKQAFKIKKFKPAILNGKNVKSSVVIPVVFKLG